MFHVAALQAEYQAAGFAATHSSVMSTRNVAAILASPLRLLRLTTGLLDLLGITTTAEFGVYAAQGRHTEERHPGQFARALHAFRSGRVTHVGTHTRSRTKVEVLLVVQTASGDAVFLALKFLAADAHKGHGDECWVKTFYPWGQRSIRQALRAGKLRPVFHYERPALGEIRDQPI
jgi:hypothetical protein